MDWIEGEPGEAEMVEKWREDNKPPPLTVEGWERLIKAAGLEVVVQLDGSEATDG